MKRFVLFVFCVSALCLTSAMAQKQLICGSKFRGYGYSVATGRVSASQLFDVKKGTIRLKGSNPGYVISKLGYENFELTAQFRWADEETSRASNKPNSGIMVHVPVASADTLWPQGIQYQIKDKSTGDFVLLQEVTLKVNGQLQGPGRSVVVKRFADAEKPSGEWNAIRIVARGNEVEQYLNGVLVNKGVGASVSEGRILLQYEGFPIEFKDLKLSRLK